MIARLTPLERRALTLAANGHTNAEIGLLLGGGPYTAAPTLSRAYRKLAARSRAHAVAICLRAGLLDVDAIVRTSRGRRT